MTALAMEFQKNPPAWNSWQGTKGRLEQALFNKIRALEAAHGGPGQNRGQGRVALMISEPGRLGALASKGVSDRTILDNLLVLYKVNPAPAPEQPRQGAPKRP